MEGSGCSAVEDEAVRDSLPLIDSLSITSAPTTSTSSPSDLNSDAATIRQQRKAEKQAKKAAQASKRAARPRPPSPVFPPYFYPPSTGTSPISSLPSEILGYILDLATTMDYHHDIRHHRYSDTSDRGYKARRAFLRGVCTLPGWKEEAQILLWREIRVTTPEDAHALLSHFKEVGMTERPHTHDLSFGGYWRLMAKEVRAVLEVVEGVRLLQFKDFQRSLKEDKTLYLEDFGVSGLKDLDTVELEDCHFSTRTLPFSSSPPFHLSQLHLKNCTSTSPNFYSFFSSPHLRVINSYKDGDHGDGDYPPSIEGVFTQDDLLPDLLKLFNSVATTLRVFEIWHCYTFVPTSFVSTFEKCENLAYLVVSCTLEDAISIGELVPSQLTSGIIEASPRFGLSYELPEEFVVYIKDAKSLRGAILGGERKDLNSRKITAEVTFTFKGDGKPLKRRMFYKDWGQEKDVGFDKEVGAKIEFW